MINGDTIFGEILVILAFLRINYFIKNKKEVIPF